MNKTEGVVYGDEEYVVTPAGARYSKAKRGILPRLMVEYMADRRATKNEMLRLEQEIENIEAELKKRNQSTSSQ